MAKLKRQWNCLTSCLAPHVPEAYVSLMELKEINGVFQAENGDWCRTCKKCGSVVCYSGTFGRQAALSSNRIKDGGCRQCFSTGKKFDGKKINDSSFLEQEHLSASVETEKEYQIICHAGSNQSPRYAHQPECPPILFFKSKVIDCQACGQRRLQNVPSQFKEFRFFCHKCKARQVAQV